MLDWSVHTIIHHQWVMGLDWLLAHILNANDTKRVHEVLFLEVLRIWLRIVYILLDIERLMLILILLESILITAIVLAADEIYAVVCVLALVSLLRVCNWMVSHVLQLKLSLPRWSLEVLRRHFLVVNIVHLAINPAYLTSLWLSKSIVQSVIPADINLNLVCVFRWDWLP